MEELTQEQIIQNCIQFGVCEIIEQEIIPNAMRTRITKAKFILENIEVVQEVEYVNTVDSSSVYAIKSENRYIL